VRKLYKRAAARRDLFEHFVYLAAEGGEALLDQPEIGSPLVVNDPEMSGIRKWPVKDFENFLIF
jgi:toxin ParE1/3/4